MIKNWLVKTKQIKKSIKGFINYINYLKDENRSSHAHTRIVILNDAASNIIKSYDDRKLYRQGKGLRGGGVKNLATSFVISLPNDIKKASDSDWAKIGDFAIKRLSEELNINFDILKNVSHIVLHDESSDPYKHSHLHVSVSNIIDNHVVKSISQFKATHTVKKSVNSSVLAVLGVCNTTYKPKRKKVSDVPLWAARAAKAKSDLEIIYRAKKMRKYLIEFKDNIKNDITAWTEDFINNIFPRVEKSSLIVADAINLIEKVDPKISDQLDSMTDFIEQKKADAPEKAKVSHKRQRRRRKKLYK
jgi:hypothetical protein